MQAPHPAGSGGHGLLEILESDHPVWCREDSHSRSEGASVYLSLLDRVFQILLDLRNLPNSFPSTAEKAQ